MSIKQLSSDGKIAYLIKPILKVLQKVGGQLERSETKARISDFDITDNEEEMQEEEKIKDDFKEKLLATIAKMTPKKFEAFSRALLNRMGVEFTEKGVQISNDGGIDDYGYHTDVNDFRTIRVVIQCSGIMLLL